VDFTDKWLWMFAAGGVRINPSSLPFLYFDVGVEMEEFPVTHWGPSATIFFDGIFTIVVR
jgi:hypothetical protein